MAAWGPHQHDTALPFRVRLYGWCRARPRDAFNRAARDLRAEREPGRGVGARAIR